MSNTGERGETASLSLPQRNALIVGGVLLILGTLYGVFRPAPFFRAYLIAFEFCLGLSLGCMVVMMIRHLTGGAWGLYLRPILEAGASLVPLSAVFFLPLLIGLRYLYPWYVGGSRWVPDALPDHQMQWFHPVFFAARAVFYFAVWTGFAFFLNLGPRGPNVPPFEEPPRRFRVVSAIGIAVYGLTITFASFDWSMSLDAPWFSTIYGAMYAGGHLLAGLAFSVLVAALLASLPPSILPQRGREEYATPPSLAEKGQTGPPSQLFRDFGNLLLAFTMIWAYLSFSQFLLIWAGNLPEETVYFRLRFENGWQWMALAVLLAEFVTPFLLLLLKRVKVSARLLAVVAGISLSAHYLNLVWLTLPTFGDNTWDLLFLSPALLVGLAGVWLSLFLWRLQRRPFVSAAALHLEAPTHE